jgi:DinB superfamily
MENLDNFTSIKDAIWSQFGASLDMLENAIFMCPDEHWATELNFWYTAYHCIFWTDYYLTAEPNKFEPPSPFTFSEFEPDGKMLAIIYTKKEILGYLNHCRTKSIKVFMGLTVEKLNDRWINEYKNFSMLEILIYNLRHVQHHSAQLNLLLRQTVNDSPAWVSQSKLNL